MGARKKKAQSQIAKHSESNEKSGQFALPDNQDFLVEREWTI